MEHLKAFVRDVPDFPIPGILFKDITTLLKHPQALAEVVRAFETRYHGQPIDLVAGIEARGFMFGVPLAVALGAGFVPVRKPGKLPADTVGVEYALEYGTSRLEMHRDAVEPGQRVLLIDDLLATGGTARASAQLVETLGGEVAGVAFVLELAFLNGRDTLAGYEVFSLLTY